MKTSSGSFMRTWSYMVASTVILPRRNWALAWENHIFGSLTQKSGSLIATWATGTAAAAAWAAIAAVAAAVICAWRPQRPLCQPSEKKTKTVAWSWSRRRRLWWRQKTWKRSERRDQRAIEPDEQCENEEICVGGWTSATRMGVWRMLERCYDNNNDDKKRSERRY